MTPTVRRRYLSVAVDAAKRRGARAVLADIGGHLAPGRTDLPLVAETPDPALAPPPELAVPELLGAVYEAVLDPARRRRRGAFYTPPAVAAELAAATLAGLGPDASVWDPAVGGGSLLLAAARELISAGADAAAVVSSQLGGVDTDALAVDVAVTALGVLAGGNATRVGVGDGLAVTLSGWDAVVANPPFLGQLKSDTARSREEAARLGIRFGTAASGYADEAGLFLLASLDCVRDEGVVGFVLPAALIATRDGAAIREAVGAATTLVRLWSPSRSGQDFDAGVRVVLAVARKRPPVGSGFWRCGAWSSALSRTGGPPPVRVRSDGVVGDIAVATADFRDQYYAVADAVREGGDAGHAVVTCGLIDPARVRWGERPARIGRRTWSRPRAVGLTGAAAAWSQRRLVPKVMVATQTRVIEAAADEDGRWLPAVPVISVVPTTGDVWALLAVLLAPAVSAHARRAHAGAALSTDAIKLSARQVAALPLPADRLAWTQGAAAAREATDAARRGDGPGWTGALRVLGDAMADAYGVAPVTLRSWWWERIGRLTAPGGPAPTP
jgi:N-6 DNA Methylase